MIAPIAVHWPAPDKPAGIGSLRIGATNHGSEAMRLGLIGSTGHWQTYSPALGQVEGLTLVAVAPAGPEEALGAFDHAPGLTATTKRYDDARELAADDDTYFADPLLKYTFSKDGDYVIQVSDSKYDGDPRWVYALTVTDRPYVSHTFPMAANPGQSLTVENCVARNFAGSGMVFAYAGTNTATLVVADSSFTDNAADGIGITTSTRPSSTWR